MRSPNEPPELPRAERGHLPSASRTRSPRSRLVPDPLAPRDLVRRRAPGRTPARTCCAGTACGRPARCRAGGWAGPGCARRCPRRGWAGPTRRRPRRWCPSFSSTFASFGSPSCRERRLHHGQGEVAGQGGVGQAHVDPQLLAGDARRPPPSGCGCRWRGGCARRWPRARASAARMPAATRSTGTRFSSAERSAGKLVARRPTSAGLHLGREVAARRASPGPPWPGRTR